MSATNQDIIFIEALQTEAIIGIYDWEQEQPQPLIIDIDMTTDLKKAALSDDINDTICYNEVSNEVDDLVRKSRFELLETLAEAICQHLFSQHPAIQQLRLKINKPNAVAKADATGLIITRTRLI